ncbi:MAG TPA: phytoene/squalene synthase family protein [Methanoculleus sp.]|nr:phytoene/squalene synthase family protein [Methanoculleus sp.]
MMHRKLFSIFRQGSTTYFYSTLFFPPVVRAKVFVLYSFVRVADDYVDAIPQQADAFYAFRDAYRKARAGMPAGDVVIDSFVHLMEECRFDPAWVEAFLASMEADLTHSPYRTIEELETYLYGSSEVIGLMMARILELPEASWEAARSLGKAMQLINFIRDIEEDCRMERTYLPAAEYEACGLAGITEADARRDPGAFGIFLRSQIERYEEWRDAGEDGYRYIPFRYLIPIRTASDMYSWTARVIARDPMVVFRAKVKPTPLRVVSGVARNIARTPGGGRTHSHVLR